MEAGVNGLQKLFQGEQPFRGLFPLSRTKQAMTPEGATPAEGRASEKERLEKKSAARLKG